MALKRLFSTGKALRLTWNRFYSEDKNLINPISELYPELDEKIISRREKDMPVSVMENPFEREKALCVLCRLKIYPEYKNIKLLSQFVSPYTGNVYGRHITGLCEQQQKILEAEIMKARDCGLMPYYFKAVEFLHDPHLFDPERPLRPHRF